MRLQLHQPFGQIVTAILVFTAMSGAAQTVPDAPAVVTPDPVVIVNPAPEGVVSTPVGNVPAGALQIWNIGALGLTVFSLFNLAGETESAGGSF